MAAELIAVAARRAPADIVIRNCAWVNVHSREVIPGSDIAIKAGRFASCGPDAAAMIGPETRVIEARRALSDPRPLRRAHARRVAAC